MCSTDKVVYIKTIRMLFKKLFEDQKSTGQEFVTQKIGEKAATCIEYQVSSKPVALHHPLTRLLSGMKNTVGQNPYILSYFVNVRFHNILYNEKNIYDITDADKNVNATNVTDFA